MTSRLLKPPFLSEKLVSPPSGSRSAAWCKVVKGGDDSSGPQLGHKNSCPIYLARTSKKKKGLTGLEPCFTSLWKQYSRSCCGINIWPFERGSMTRAALADVVSVYQSSVCLLQPGSSWGDPDTAGPSWWRAGLENCGQSCRPVRTCTCNRISALCFSRQTHNTVGCCFSVYIDEHKWEA